MKNVRVSARDDQGECGIFDWRIFERDGIDMSLDVVDADERDVERPCKRLGITNAYKQRADQSGPLSNGERLDVLQLDGRFCERLLDNGLDLFEVFTRGKLGHHAAPRAMQIDLRGDNRRNDLASVTHDGGRGLVARAFDSQDQHTTSIQDGNHEITQKPTNLFRAFSWPFVVIPCPGTI